MNTHCPPKRVPSADRFFSHCGLTMQPPKSHTVGGQRSSRTAYRQARRLPARLQGSLVRAERFSNTAALLRHVRMEKAIASCGNRACASTKERTDTADTAERFSNTAALLRHVRMEKAIASCGNRACASTKERTDTADTGNSVVSGSTLQ
ncbi:UNVERIFIED_CONTAM: hypothetical protein FKN15_030031 [Acipenser sinensis]